MKTFQEMTKEELLQEQERLMKAYEDYAAKGLKLDMSRGKPSSEQLDLSMDMLDVLNSKSLLKSVILFFHIETSSSTIFTCASKL